MDIKTHHLNGIQIAELASETTIINSIEDGVDLLGNLYYQGFDKIIIGEHNITPDFFDLKTGIAGEILQKFSNYRMGLAIVGDFEKFNSKSLNDFIYESNRAGRTVFVGSLTEALDKLSKG